MASVVGPDHGLGDADIEAMLPEIERAHATLQAWRMSQDAIFHDLPTFPGLTKGILEKAADITHRFDHLVVLGIGGSALGLRFLAGAFLSPVHNLLEKKERHDQPQLFVLP